MGRNKKYQKNKAKVIVATKSQQDESEDMEDMEDNKKTYQKKPDEDKVECNGLYDFGVVTIERKLTHQQLLMLLASKRVCSVRKICEDEKLYSRQCKIKPLLNAVVHICMPSDVDSSDSDSEPPLENKTRKVVKEYHRNPLANRSDVMKYIEFMISGLRLTIKKLVENSLTESKKDFETTMAQIHRDIKDLVLKYMPVSK